MKLFAATLFTAAALIAAPVAHADHDADYIAYMKAHGMHPAKGESEIQWEATVIEGGHAWCDLAPKEGGREGVKAHYAAKNPDKAGLINDMIDGAIAVYCPQYW